MFSPEFNMSPPRSAKAHILDLIRECSEAADHASADAVDYQQRAALHAVRSERLRALAAEYRALLTDGAE